MTKQKDVYGVIIAFAVLLLVSLVYWNFVDDKIKADKQTEIGMEIFINGGGR